MLFCLVSFILRLISNANFQLRLYGTLLAGRNWYCTTWPEEPKWGTQIKWKNMKYKIIEMLLSRTISANQVLSSLFFRCSIAQRAHYFNNSNHTKTNTNTNTPWYVYVYVCIRVCTHIDFNCATCNAKIGTVFSVNKYTNEWFYILMIATAEKYTVS